MDIIDNIGKRVNFARKAKGLTRQQLADKIEKPISYINNLEIENGKAPQLGNLIAVATALDTSVAYLIGETNEISFSANEVLKIKIGSRREILTKIDKLLRDISGLSKHQNNNISQQWTDIMKLDSVSQNPELLISIATIGKEIMEFQKLLIKLSELATNITQGLHKSKSQLFSATNFNDDLTDEPAIAQTEIESIDITHTF